MSSQSPSLSEKEPALDTKRDNGVHEGLISPPDSDSSSQADQSNLVTKPILSLYFTFLCFQVRGSECSLAFFIGSCRGKAGCDFPFMGQRRTLFWVVPQSYFLMASRAPMGCQNASNQSEQDPTGPEALTLN